MRWQIFKLGLVLSLILSALWLSDIELRAQILDPQLAFAILSGATISLLAIILNSWRHSILVASQRAPLTAAFKSIVLAGGLNLVIPGRLAETIKITYLRKNLGIRISHGLTAIFIERTLDVIVLGLISLLTLASGVLNTAMVMPALAIVFLVILAGIKWPLGPLRRYLSSKEGRVSNFIISGIDHYYSISSSISTFYLIFVSVSIWIIQLVSCVVFLDLQPFGEVSLWNSCLVFVAVNLAVAVPGPPAGVGLFQLSVAAVLVPNGFSFEIALLIGLTLQVAVWAPLIILAPIFLVRESTGVLPLIKDALSAAKGAGKF